MKGLLQLLLQIVISRQHICFPFDLYQLLADIAHDL